MLRSKENVSEIKISCKTYWFHFYEISRLPRSEPKLYWANWEPCINNLAFQRSEICRLRSAKQLNDLGKKIDRVIQPVFTSKKISEDLKVTETKPSLVNQQCVVYEFQCNSCDSSYIGYTSRHLHLRIEEHKYSVIGKHLQDKHNPRPINLHEQFTILKKCHGKFECLIYEMPLTRKKRPTLNTQNDSIPAKLFI